jgi:hypothetical protein
MSIPKKTRGSEIADFIRESGFILELESAEFLEKNGYQVEPNQFFFDADENKKREIDLIAKKLINGVTVCLVIECKQNLGDEWIFVSSQKNPVRYYSELKHSPKIPFEILSKHKAYDDLHIYNPKFPLAQNYVVYRKDKGKKARVEPLQISECIFKLPKALIWVAANGAKSPTIYYPVALFSGNLFEVRYKGGLVIKERALMQLQTTIESSGYTQSESLSSPIHNSDLSKVVASNRKLGKEYTIDFINRKGLTRYLSLIEKEISKLDVALWPVTPIPSLENVIGHV